MPSQVRPHGTPSDPFIDHHEPNSIWIFCRYPKGIYNAVRGWARHEADADGYRLAQRFFAKNPAVPQLPIRLTGGMINCGETQVD